MNLYQLVEASSSQPLPLVFRASGATKKTFAVACPPFGSVTMSNGVTLRCIGPAPTKPTELGPESVHAAIALAHPGHAPPPRPSDADLVCILDACGAAFDEAFVDIPAGIAGNDSRPSNLRNAAQWLAGEGVPAPLVREFLGPYLNEWEHAFVETTWAAGETPYSPHVAHAAIRRRDELVARKVQETSTKKKVDAGASKMNTRTLRELGLWAFRIPYTYESKSVLFTHPLMHAGYKYALVERFAGLAAYACTFEAGLELMPDDFVLETSIGRLNNTKRIPITTGEPSRWIVDRVLMSRSPRIVPAPVDVASLHTDDDLDGSWRLKLAEKVAWPWLDLRIDLAVSALVVGLELAPAVVEEAWLLLPSIQAERVAAERSKMVEKWDDGVTTVRGGAEAYDASKREAIRAAIMRVVKGEGIFHERGELYAPPSRADLDALAIETGRDPIRSVLASLVGGKKSVTGEDIDRALAEHAPKAPNNSWWQRVAAAMRSFGFEKKTVPNEKNESGAGKAFVRVEPVEPTPVPVVEVEADPWPPKNRTVVHGFDREQEATPSNGAGG